MRFCRPGTFAALLVVLASPFAHAAPREMTINGVRLLLNGKGVHEATLFKVDVYSASLYLEKPSNDAETIVASPGLKVVELEFHRNVSRDAVREAWLSDLEESCGGTCTSTLASASLLLQRLPDIQSGQKITYTFFRDRVEVRVDGTLMGALPGGDSARAVLSAFIGKKTPAIHIRAALLGATESS